jgi:membrane peptidoglycan carboxypeptidase
MAQRSRFFSVLMALGGFVTASVVAGALIAAAITPALGMTAQLANGSIGLFEDLPEYIDLGTQAQQNTVLANRGGKEVEIATIYDQNRQEVESKDISPYIKDAAIDGEDRRFYDHGGVDLNSIVRAAYTNATTDTVSGSSTLDMQLVKNILVQQALQNPDPTARKVLYARAIDDSVPRKLKEMKLAIGLDKRYTKQQILTGYLNIVGFGGSTYGVETASERYFSVPAKDVTVAQAASLIAIVQQPNNQNLGDPKLYDANKERRDEILADMLDAKHITQKQYDEAMATKIADEVKLSELHNGCLYASDAKFACDYVQRLVPTLAALGDDPATREANWERGGYKIYTSIDLDRQDVAQAALNASAPASETRFALGAAADAIEPGTGRILVMAQNLDYDNSGAPPPTATSVNYSVDKAMGQSSGFPTGSTYKIFTLTDWLEKGHGLNEIVDGSVRSFPYASFKASCTSQNGPPYAPKNDGAGEGGSMSVMQATAESVNAAFVGMAQKLDLCDIRDAAAAMGVHRADGTPLKVIPASVLGVNEIAPLTMADAIATIGANGVYCVPTIIDKLVGPDGKELVAQPKQCNQAIAPNIAGGVAYALAGVMKAGTGSPGKPRDNIPIVGKTGTNDGASQNWLIATTTKAALAVWVGNTDGGVQSLRKITVAGTNGYNTKFNIFRATMTAFDQAYGGEAFPPVDPTLLRGSNPPPPPSGSSPTAPSTPSPGATDQPDGGTH